MPTKPQGMFADDTEAILEAEVAETTLALVQPQETALVLPSYLYGDGLPTDLSPADLRGKIPTYVLNHNLKESGVIEGLLPMTGECFYDNVEGTFFASANVVFILMGRVGRLFKFNGRETVTYCYSPDMVQGAATENFIWTTAHERPQSDPAKMKWTKLAGVTDDPKTGFEFIANEWRNCRTCPLSKDEAIGRTFVFAPCCEEWVFLGFNIDTETLFKFRCRITSLAAARDFLRKLLITEKVGGKPVPKMLPLYYYRVKLSAEKAAKGVHYVPIFEVTGGVKPYNNAAGEVCGSAAWTESEMAGWAELSALSADTLTVVAKEEADVNGDADLPPEDKPY